MARSSTAKPRVVVVGAGTAGLSAAYHLHRSSSESFDLKVLEASARIGGRICTTSFGGDQVELGATWIHGIEGSPIYRMAESIGALDSKQQANWERQDGFPTNPTLLAEGGLIVEESVVEPAIEAFNLAIAEVKGIGEWKEKKQKFSQGTVGSFVRNRMEAFLEAFPTGNTQLGSGWDLKSLQKAVYHVQEDAERLGTASNSLFDLDLDSEKEYQEFPGEHITIPGGYVSFLKEMARSLPSGTIQFGKKVLKIMWNHSHPSSSSPVVIFCEDGSVIEADHVILTVSLGVLKSMTSKMEALPSGICRSVDEMFGDQSASGKKCQLFEPALPSWKVKSISQLGFGLVDKMFLLIDQSAEPLLRSYLELIPRRDSGIPSSIPRWMKKTFSLGPIYENSNVLLCWFAGGEAVEMESLSDEEVIDGVVAALISYGLGKSQSDNNESMESQKERLKKLFHGVLRSNWASNPLFKGSYTYVAAGATGKDIEILAEPLPANYPVVHSLFSENIQSAIEELPEKLSKVVLSQSSNSNTLSQPISRSSSGSQLSSLSLTSTSTSTSSASSSDHEEEYEDECNSEVTSHSTVPLESKPLQILFAGEATHRHFYSTTHGAFLSGGREANRILKFYNYSK